MNHEVNSYFASAYALLLLLGPIATITFSTIVTSDHQETRVLILQERHRQAPRQGRRGSEGSARVSPEPHRESWMWNRLH